MTAALAGLAGCSAEDGAEAPLESEQLHGVEETGGDADAITATYPAGTRVQTTSNLNLRTGPSTSYRTIVVIPNSTTLTLASDPGPRGGYYRVGYGAQTGYVYGGFLRVTSAAPAGSGGGGSTSGAGVDGAIARARSGVGFSYWWGHGRWASSGATSSNAGECNGSCPSCSHSGSYGADCSGFIAKVWQTPGANSSLSVDSHPYSTEDFIGSTGGGQWSRVSRGSARRGDALVYRSGGSGHIFLYESGDAWGQMWAYEARGCSSGITHNLRSAATAYVAIRRTGY